MKRPGIALRIAFILAERDLSDAPTLGDLMEILPVRKGTATGERLREARNYYDVPIKCDRTGRVTGKRNAYWLPEKQRQKIKARADFKAWKARRAA